MTSVKRDRPRAERGLDGLTEARAAAEARELLSEMRAQLEALGAFVVAQENELRVRRPSPKRLARLRLMSEDLQSARTFASKPPKG